MITQAPELLTVREVARKLRIGTRTVWKWTTSGHLPPPLRLGQSGRTVRWKASEIDRFIAHVAPRNESPWDFLSGDKRRVSE